MKGGPWVDMPLKRVFVSPLAGLWGDEPQSDADDITVVRHADFQRERFVADGPFPTVRSVPRHQSLPRMLAPDDILIEKSGFPGYPALYVRTSSRVYGQLRAITRGSVGISYSTCIGLGYRERARMRPRSPTSTLMPCLRCVYACRRSKNSGASPRS
jgi:hypothetical protein